MADITKRTAKKIADHLQPDEQVLHALLLEPKDTYGAGMAALALLPRTSSRALARKDAAERAEEGGIAAALPAGSMALVITDRRVLACPSNGMTFKPPALGLEHHQVRVGEITGKMLGRSFSLLFEDGSGARFSAQRGQPFDAVAAVLGTAGDGG